MLRKYSGGEISDARRERTQRQNRINALWDDASGLGFARYAT
jgi:hypothetical protein